MNVPSQNLQPDFTPQGEYGRVLDLLGTLEAAELPNGDFVVTAHGPLDERVAGELRDVLLPLTAGDGGLVLDLLDAHGLDARALAIVACAGQMLRQRQRHLALVTRSPLLQRLVDEAGIADLVELRKTLSEAICVD